MTNIKNKSTLECPAIQEAIDELRDFIKDTQEPEPVRLRMDYLINIIELHVRELTQT